MQEKEDWDFSDDFFFLAPSVILWEQTFTAQVFLFFFSGEKCLAVTS